MACTTQETPDLAHPTDHVGAPAPGPCTADPSQRAEVGYQWLQPVFAADWPG